MHLRSYPYCSAINLLSRVSPQVLPEPRGERRDPRETGDAAKHPGFVCKKVERSIQVKEEQSKEEFRLISNIPLCFLGRQNTFLILELDFLSWKSLLPRGLLIPCSENSGWLIS